MRYYTVKDNKIMYLYDIYNVNSITVRENIKTKKEEIFLTGEMNGSEFIDRLDIKDRYAISKVSLFTKVQDALGDGMTAHYYYVNDIKTSEDDYNKALNDFEINYRMVKDITPYEININYNSERQNDKFIDYLDEYIINQTSTP